MFAARFPEKPMYLVGDSGAKDPEIYGNFARRAEGRVKRIAIRDVTSEDASAPRYERAFRDLDRQLWTIYGKPSSLFR